MPRPQVYLHWGVYRRQPISVFLSHIDISPSLFLSHFLSKISKSVKKVRRRKKRKSTKTLPWLGPSVGCSIVPRTRGCGFESRLRHMPGLQVQSLVRPHMGGDISMFLISFSLSPSPSSLWKKNSPVFTFLPSWHRADTIKWNPSWSLCLDLIPLPGYWFHQSWLLLRGISKLKNFIKRYCRCLDIREVNKIKFLRKQVIFLRSMVATGSTWADLNSRTALLTEGWRPPTSLPLKWLCKGKRSVWRKEREKGTPFKAPSTWQNR